MALRIFKVIKYCFAGLIDSTTIDDKNRINDKSILSEWKHNLSASVYFLPTVDWKAAGGGNFSHRRVIGLEGVGGSCEKSSNQLYQLYEEQKRLTWWGELSSINTAQLQLAAD